MYIVRSVCIEAFQVTSEPESRYASVFIYNTIVILRTTSKAVASVHLTRTILYAIIDYSTNKLHALTNYILFASVSLNVVTKRTLCTVVQ